MPSPLLDPLDRRPHALPSFRWPPRTMAVALAICGALSGACSSSDADPGGDGDESASDDDDEDAGEKEKTDTKKPDAGTKAPPKGEDKDEPDTKVPVKEDDGVEKCAGIRQDAPATKGGVDVIFLIDTSGSMFHAVGQVTTNMATFVSEFDDSNADTRVVVITELDPAAGTPLASDSDRYRFISSEVDSKQLFQSAIDHFPRYQDFLRPNAATQFVMITDDNDRLMPPAFKQQMAELLGHDFTQHAVASESVDGFPCINEVAAELGCDLSQLVPGLPAVGIPAVCGAAAVGTAYYSLADDTGGKTLSICKGDWTEIFEELKVAVIEAVPLPCDYPLSDASSEEFDPKKVNILYSEEGGDPEAIPKTTTRDSCGDKLGWHYDDEAAPTMINLCPASCEQMQNGGTIDIEFGCAPPIIF